MTIKYGHVCFACWMTKATDTHSECVILIAFHGSSGNANGPHCCVYMYIASLVNTVLLYSFFLCYLFKNLGVRLIQENLKSVVLVRDQRKAKFLFFVILIEMLNLCSFYSYCVKATFNFRCGPLPVFF
jgi:hypothetical protein